MDSKTARIRALNDGLRQNFAEGIAVMTPGIAALGAEAVARIVKTVAVFDDFCHAQRPARRTRLWCVRRRRPSNLFQNRLLRREPHASFTGSS
jgi:hypothetical protein